MCAYVYVGVLTENNVVFFLGAGASSLSKLQLFEEEIFLRAAFLRAVFHGTIILGTISCVGGGRQLTKKTLTLLFASFILDLLF